MLLELPLVAVEPKMAVSGAPGTPFGDQFRESDQLVSVPLPSVQRKMDA